MAENLKEKDIVSVVEVDETFNGVVVEVKKTKCLIQFDGDGDPETHKIADVTLVESYEEKGNDEVSLEDQLKGERVALELEKAELAEQQKELKQQQDQINANIEKSIKISDSQVDFGKYNKSDNPKALAAEVEKQKENIKKRHTNRIAKAKKAAQMTPVQIRKGVLTARLTKVRMRHHNNYKKEQIELWAQELTIIIQTPDAWSKNCVRPQKQLSAMDKLDKLMADNA